MTEPASSRGLVLDASVAINMFASGRVSAILTAWPAPVVIERRTRSEVRTLRDREAENLRAAVRSVDWSEVENAQAITVVDLADLELDRFVQFTYEMDNGEAAAGAYAVAHRLELAIDDRKARRILERHVTCRWSLELLETWARNTAASTDEVTTALSSIRRYANWKPHTGHPLASWWDTFVVG